MVSSDNDRLDGTNVTGILRRHELSSHRPGKMPQLRKTALQERLPEIMLFELTKSGGREYHTLTLRSLYDYVLRTITIKNRTSDEISTPNDDSFTENSDITCRNRSSSVSMPVHPDNAQHVTYRERLGGYLHPRDMRRLVTPFSSSNEPELIIRRHVMLLNFDPFRAIVLRDRLLVIVPDGADSMLFLLERSMSGKEYFLGEMLIENGCTGEKFQQCSENHTQNDLVEEWKDIEERNWIELPFEFQAVDAVLSSVCQILSDDLDDLQMCIIKVMKELRQHDSSGDHVQERLRMLKDEIKELEPRIQGLVRAVTGTLNEEEDMALMNLSRLISHPERFIQPVSSSVLTEESDEPELILEAYLQQALSQVNAIELLKGNVINTEELISVQMDTMRNRLLYINALVSVASFCVASSSLVGSMFGMNLKNPYEDNEHTFLFVVLLTVVLSLIVFGLFLLLLIKLEIFPIWCKKVY